MWKVEGNSNKVEILTNLTLKKREKQKLKDEIIVRYGIVPSTMCDKFRFMPIFPSSFPHATAIYFSLLLTPAFPASCPAYIPSLTGNQIL